jgi:adenylate kinase
MVRDRLTDETAQPGFLLDGFPRTLEQVIALDEILDEQHHELTAVLDF